MEQRLRILVLGGYGKFGGQLAELLCDEPTAELIIAGRSQAKAKAFCDRLPSGAACEGMAIDRDGDVEVRLKSAKPDIVVDASGPFQAYGDDPYRIAKAAISVGAHYLDFADGTDFVRGIVQLDERARDAGVVVLSGVSSFPVLTAAIVRHLASDLARIDSIIGGIAPTPFAGVGLSVITAIAGYAGQQVLLRDRGRSRVAYPLTETRRYTIAPPGFLPLDPIEFSLVDVPDHQVLPELWPDVETVWIGAGPVPAFTHRIFRGLAHLVRWGLLPSLEPFARLLFHGNNIFRWGEHRGGMFIEIEGTLPNGQPVKRAWHLLAEGNDGTFIPCMAIDAIVRKWIDGDPPAVGARIATKEVELSDYEKRLANRRIFAGDWREDSISDPCLYGRLLGEAWLSLPSSVRTLHSVSPRLEMAGQARVERGTGLLARTIAATFGFPRAADQVDVSVIFERSENIETWTRTFGDQVLLSTQFEGKGRFERLLCERFGPFVFAMALVQDADRLQLVVRRWSAFGIPMPRFLRPGGKSYEFDDDGTFNFHVEISVPLAGLVVHYVGYLEPNDKQLSAEVAPKPLE